MKWLKQLFCEHIWKLAKNEYLDSAFIMVNGSPVKEVKRYLETMQCVHCEMVKKEEKRVSRFINYEEREVYQERLFGSDNLK